jgi:hypothetical protein
MAELAGKELEEALLSYCKNATAVADPAILANDASFDKGIGGTKEDHIKEKVLEPYKEGLYTFPLPPLFHPIQGLACIIKPVTRPVRHAGHGRDAPRPGCKGWINRARKHAL